MSAAADVDFTKLMQAANIDHIKLMQEVVNQLKTIQRLTQESMKFIELEEITKKGDEVKKWLRTLDKGFSDMRRQARKDVGLAAFILKHLSQNEPFAKSKGLQQLQALEENFQKIVEAASVTKSEMDDTKISVEGLMDKTQTVLPDTSIAMEMAFGGFVTGGLLVGALECSSCCGAVGTLALGGGFVLTGGVWLALAAALGALGGAALTGIGGFFCDKVKEWKFGNKLSELQGALKEMHDLLDADSLKIASFQKMAVDGSVWTGKLSGIIRYWEIGGCSWETAAGELKEKSDAFAAMEKSLEHAVEGGQGTWRDGKLLAAGAVGGAMGGLVVNCLKKK